jgi:hypothetical protein
MSLFSGKRIKWHSTAYTPLTNLMNQGLVVFSRAECRPGCPQTVLLALADIQVDKQLQNHRLNTPFGTL